MFKSLYSDLGVQCSQCGRRFTTDAEGKKKKTAHMDWHFQARQRRVEAEKRGQYRSHYVSKQVSLSPAPFLYPPTIQLPLSPLHSRPQLTKSPGLDQIPRGDRPRLPPRRNRASRRGAGREAPRAGVHTRPRARERHQHRLPHLPGALREQVARLGAGVGVAGRQAGGGPGVPRELPRRGGEGSGGGGGGGAGEEEGGGGWGCQG